MERPTLVAVTIDAVRSLLLDGRWAWIAHTQQAAGGWQVSAADLVEMLEWMNGW